MRPQPKPASSQPCLPGEHSMPEEWDYTYEPAGEKTCLKPGCFYTIYD
jgi:hypothetical protein